MKLEDLKKQVKKGEFYSRYFEENKFIILPKEVIDEIMQIITPENFESLQEYQKEDIYSERDFICSMINDIILNKTYQIFDIEK